jgi:alpha,alpha-trehalase
LRYSKCVPVAPGAEKVAALCHFPLWNISIKSSCPIFNLHAYLYCYTILFSRVTRFFIPALDAAEQNLREALEDISGCLVERKKFSIAIHYRQVAQDEVESVRKKVEQIHADRSELRLMQGKKIFELQPDIEWNKGKAIHWLSSKLELNKKCFTLLYIGDDVTDEDAFRVLGAEDLGILVTEEDQQTFATYRLPDPAGVEIFLNMLCNKLEDTS